MNVVLPVDFQSYVPGQSLTGTADAQAENSAKSTIIQPPQAAGEAAKNTQKNPQQTPSLPSKDKVSISAEGKNASESDNELTDEEQDQVKELKDRDREVKIHEQAHAAVGGQYAGSPSYEYETGPDGKRYAVGGEVSIDVGEEEKPEDTIQKMQIVRAAALAPAEPSTQDLKVAAEASQKEQQARSQLSQDTLQGDDSPPAGEGKTETNSQSSASAQQSKLAYAYERISADPVQHSISTSA